MKSYYKSIPSDKGNSRSHLISLLYNIRISEMSYLIIANLSIPKPNGNAGTSIPKGAKT